MNEHSPGYRIRGAVVGLLCALCAACGGAAPRAVTAPSGPPKPVLKMEEVMIPMRDGVRLQTVILTPIDQKGALPILLQRTPYGVPDKSCAADCSPTNVTLASGQVPIALKELAQDGYIFVMQNVRGRFKSEGAFGMLSAPIPDDPKAANEATDAYDTIDWLVKNVPNNNGRVGIHGTSYDGFLAAVCLLNPHPALKAISEQASPVDEWMNDDMHHYGALRESYAVEYSVLEEADKNANTHFDFKVYDTYQWYLDLGPLRNVDARYLHGSIPYWNAMVAHPDDDKFWQTTAWTDQLHASTVPTLNVAGFYDQEDPWGPWQIFRRAEQSDPEHTSVIVAGPWYHGEWSAEEGDHIGIIPFGGHKTAVEFRAQVRAPFFRYYLHESGAKPAWQATTFQTGSNRWRSYAAWPPRSAKLTQLFLQTDGTLTFTAPQASSSAQGYREYVSDPANPVPYRARPISPTYPGGDWPSWEVSDQRFVDHRPDVLSYLSAPLEHDITVTGPLAAKLFASTSGTDSDFVVKLIDLYPEVAQHNAWKADQGPAPGQYAESLNGYELPIAMEVRRGRYLASFQQPRALVANQPTEWNISLRDHDHVFLKGHRIMVQIQSTWFPLIDRNPQKFVPSIYQAVGSDFIRATQRIYSSPALASYLQLPLVSDAQ